MKKAYALICCVLAALPLFALEAVVVSVVGKAEVQTAQGWQPMKAGEKITKGTLISTGFKSQAVLGIGRSTVTVRPLSRLTVQELTENPDKDISKVYLDAGSIKADIKAAQNKRVGFTVKSPVATASVRGTAGIFDAAGFLQSTDGTWAVAANTLLGEREVHVSKGSSIAPAADGTIIEPQERNADVAVPNNPLTTPPSQKETSSSAPSSVSEALKNAGEKTTSPDTSRIVFEIGFD